MNRCGTHLDIPTLRYAEADATAVAELLTDRIVGTFDPADVTLLVGSGATTPAVKAALRDVALAAQPSDLLFCYFAGHGITPPWHTPEDLYLGTADLDTGQLHRDPDCGLRLDFLKRDVFETSPGTSFLVLDCCHAGNWVDRPAGRVRPLPNALGTYEPALSRHSALLSCPSGAEARERADLGHGVFTHHLLAALRGAAAGANGQVTFADAARFVTGVDDLQPAPGQFVQSWGPTTVLTRPAIAAALQPRQQPAPEAATAQVQVQVVACENPLDRYASSLAQFLDRVFRSGGPAARPDRTTGSAADSAALERIRGVVEATDAAVVEFGAQPRVVLGTAGFREETFRDLLDQTAAKVMANRRASLGYVAQTDAGRQLLAVPLAHDNKDRTSSLVLVDPARALLDMGEPLAILLRAVWLTDSKVSPLEAEVRVITALRKHFGRLPLSTYTYCFDLYRQLLDSLVMAFEPVMSLSTSPATIGVHSYEALARRDGQARTAPVDVLDIPYQWGDQFVIERDCVLAAKAVRSYAEAHARSVWRQDSPKALSINVAVRSLLSRAYADTLRGAVHDAGLGRGMVTLEISERDPIAPAPDERWLPNPKDYFRERLTELAGDLHVDFAVDDFGVEHASLDRLSSLDVTQIKVDRAILHHPLALDELRLVVKVAQHALRRGGASAPRCVIIEGFDSSAPVSLKDLYDMGIHYVQGYITEEPASAALRPLGDDLRHRVASAVRGTA